MDFSQDFSSQTKEVDTSSSSTSVSGMSSSRSSSSNSGASGGGRRYTRLDPSLLPPLYLVWDVTSAGDSGKVHSDAKQRWLQVKPLGL
jgi:hypothetical protein